MQTFLQLVATNLLSRFGDSISEVTLVFPSRRAGLFFNSYLAELLNKPVWSPPTITLSELMQRIANLKTEDSIKLVTKLYNIYNSIKGTNEPFDNFYYWGEVMLADFDQVDKYLVDPKQLFGNIRDLKEIEEKFSGFTTEQAQALSSYLGVMEKDDDSEIKKNYLSIWDKLHEIYKQFWSELEDEGVAYEGMIYRKCAQILDDASTTPDIPSPIAFIGFNALNECERSLFKRCKTMSNALFYWDYDPTFLNRPENEAGLFIRRNLSQFPNALGSDAFETLNRPKKSIKMIAAPSTVAQTKLIPRMLDEIAAQGGKLDISSAIIFPKENILLPALQAIPQTVEALNITMGYPLKETPAFSLAEFLVRLQINSNTSSEGTARFYHRDVIAILNHPYVRLCEPSSATELLQDVKRGNRIYPTKDELSRTQLFSNIFALQPGSKPLTGYVLSICNAVAQNISQKTSLTDDKQLRIDLEFLFTLHKSLTRLGDVLNGISIEISHRVFLQLLRKAFNQERVSFSGEPLSGLQVMGFLESRALDFENIIILSFNDDVIPGKNHPVSFITPSLRVAFNLPNYKHHDAIYAYYFYRLMHRAKNIYLVYSSRTEGLSSGEKSRFALQLEMEQLYGKTQTVDVAYNISLTPNQPIEIPKTERVMDALLSNLNRKGKGIMLSPSGLTTYLTCPLRFYFRYAAGLYDEDEITEEVGALEFGRIIHGTMEELYKEYSGKSVSSSMVADIMSKPNNVEQTLDRVFAEEFFKDSKALSDNLSGRNRLARNAMLHIIKKMLNLDKQRAPFTLVSHELEVEISIPISSSKYADTIRLGGIVDRIEQNKGSIWSIDYKTGRADSKGVFDTVDDLFNSDRVDKYKEVFQTFCYSLALSEVYPDLPIIPMLWFVKTAKTVNDFSIKQKEKQNYTPVSDFRIYADDFKLHLSNLLVQIMDTSIPFTQTDDENKCRTCPFAAICGRG
ncbi:MAG: PD-(D/E)XK nuclease family protein [Bacteroidales bacterium]|nr:PD-(D/E)XK nuclease family protein [Bacteroidales bacterium]